MTKQEFIERCLAEIVKDYYDENYRRPANETAKKLGFKGEDLPFPKVESCLS